MNYSNKTQDPNYQKNYQKKYRELNKEKAKAYRKEYRKHYKHVPKQIELNVEDKNKKSRIYICKIDSQRIKIGATFKDSKRIYNLQKLAEKLGFKMIPLFYFDCENDSLIKEIEYKIKAKYCDESLGLNLNSFKKEVSSIDKLKDITYYIQSKLHKSNSTYQITIHK